MIGNFVKDLPLFFVKDGLIVKTSENLSFPIDNSVKYRFSTIFSTPKWAGYGLVMLYDKEIDALDGHYKWIDILLELYNSM